MGPSPRDSSGPLFWLQGLRDHYLALEVLYHIRIEPDFGGLPGDRHGIDFVLQFEQCVKQVFRARRTAGYIDVHGDDLIDTLQHGVGVERAADGRTGAHRDNPLRIRHLVVDTLYHWRHLQRYSAGYDHK